MQHRTGVGPRGITGTGRKIVLGCLYLPSEIHDSEERSLSRGIAPQEHPKGFNWGGFNRGG